MKRTSPPLCLFRLFLACCSLWFLSFQSCFRYAISTSAEEQAQRLETHVSRNERESFCHLLQYPRVESASLLFYRGQCAEYALCECKEDIEAAVEFYKDAARCGESRAIAALQRLQVAVPEHELLLGETTLLPDFESRPCGLHSRITPAGWILGAPILVPMAALSVVVGVALLAAATTFVLISLPFGGSGRLM